MAGIHFNLITGTVGQPQHRGQNLPNLIQDLSRSVAHPAVKWKQIVGHMTSLEKFTKKGHLHLPPLHFALRDSWDQSADSPFQSGIIPQEVLQTLYWWFQVDNLMRSVPPCLPLPQLHRCLHGGVESSSGVEYHPRVQSGVALHKLQVGSPGPDRNNGDSPL